MAESHLARILGRVPSGVFILTAAHNGQETGMLASWVMQAGFEPPMVTVAVNRKRYVADWLKADGPFVLNVVAEDQKSLLAHFGRGFEPGAPAFDGLEITRTTSGLPVLPGIVGYLECQSTDQLESADHHIFLARVLEGRLASDTPPMVLIRNSGRHY